MSLDRRRYAYRDDLAAISLKGQVDAPRFAQAETMQVTAATVPIRKGPEHSLPYETELLAGELFDVYEQDAHGFAWGQARRDGYVGYCPATALSRPGQAVTHRVVALRSFLYPGPSIKATPCGFLPYGARVVVTGEDGHFRQTPSGFLYATHLAPVDSRADDPVAEAEKFLGIPYLWGGKSSLGLDCSGLVQSVCFACGLFAPRDSDMQEAELGSPLDMPADPAGLPRGALLFWPGHVALSQGGGRMIHSNAFHMMVASEPIVPALARIEAAGSKLRSVRLLPRL